VIHELKVWPEYYERLADGSKTFEVRRDDRGYQSGDILRLREWKPIGDGAFTKGIGNFTGREIQRTVGFISRRGFGCDLGEYVVMSLLPGSP
jgi:uncharacterized protein DUF3850